MRVFFRRALGLLCVFSLLAGVLPAVAAEAPASFRKASGHLESAFLEWDDVAGATGYKVYVKKSDAGEDAWRRLDDPLVRQYPGYWRADALGLAAGSYVMKVVPVDGDAELEALVSGPLEVLAQDRGGYAFTGSNTPGAYKADGTLKSGAQVVYVTNGNKNSVKLGSYTGFQNIVSNVGKLGTPVAVRILGKLTGVGSNLFTIKATNANLTVEGVGSDATAYGWGFDLSGCSYVEVRNIAVMMAAGGDLDGMTVQKADHIWVHNCEFFYNKPDLNEPEGDKTKGDGSLDTKHSTYNTYSYNHFWDAGKCNLQGSGTSDTSNYITYHHNWYDHSDSRHPRVRVAHVHVYNNYYEENDEYGIGASYNSTVFAENNYFDGCTRPMLINGQGSDPGIFQDPAGGFIKAYGNIILNGTHVPYSQNAASFDYYDAQSRDEQVPSTVKIKKGGNTYDNFDTKAGFYSYDVDAAADVPEKVRAYAGRVEGGTFRFDMSRLIKGNHDPDPALQAAIDSYDSALLAVGGNAGDGSPGVHEHRWGAWETLTEADCTQPGQRQRRCSAAGCDDPVQTQDLPALGHDYVNNVCSRCGDKLSGKVYVLTGDDVYAQMEQGNRPSSFKKGGYSSSPNSYYTSSQGSHTYGTDDFFTLCYTATSRIDPVAVSFPGYEAGHRINFAGNSGSVGVGQNSVRFTLQGPAVVQVWWTGGVAANESKTPRPMVILNSKKQVVAGPSETVADNTTPMITTFTLNDPGTYDLGGQGGKNFIYKVTVTVGGGPLAAGTLGAKDELSWTLAEDGQLALAGTVPTGETVLAACWDGQGRFADVRVLTGADPAALLPEGFGKIKLLWLDGRQAPKCGFALYQPE